MSQDKSIQSLKPLIRYDKNFVYKGKKYPIDFTLIKVNSNYFYERRDKYENMEDIELANDLIDVSKDCISCFISSCHNVSFEINNENVFSLYQLSVKYEVPSLTSLTDDFIKQHGQTLIFQSIQYKFQLQKQTTNSIDIQKDEEFISMNFFNYINDEKLLNLPISILYRIINNPKLDINKLNETNKNQLIDFLFKCLDKYGGKASVLFLNLDLENQRIEVFSKLLNEYSNVFDFNMISPKFLMKTTTDLLSEMVQLKQTYSKVDQVLNQIQEEQQKQQNIFNSFKEFAQEELKKEHEKLNESFQNLNNQIQDRQQKQQNTFNSFKEFAQEELKKEHEKLNESLQNLKNKIESEQQKQQNLTDSFKKFAQEELKKESNKLNDSFNNLQNKIVNDNNNSRNENLRNINEIRSLVNQNNNKMSTFITKDVFL